MTQEELKKYEIGTPVRITLGKLAGPQAGRVHVAEIGQSDYGHYYVIAGGTAWSYSITDVVVLSATK